MNANRKSEQLYDGITEIRDDLITLADCEHTQKAVSPIRFFHKKLQYFCGGVPCRLYSFQHHLIYRPPAGYCRIRPRNRRSRIP